VSDKSCFTCRYRYRVLVPDSWGNRPYKCSQHNTHLTWGQDKGCSLWAAIRTTEERLALAEAMNKERAKVRARAALV
jgi:hypothetical protein